MLKQWPPKILKSYPNFLLNKRELNIAFYVSGGASRLRCLMKEPETGLMKSTRLVVSDSLKNEDLGNLLLDRGISFDCFNYEELKGNKQLVLSERLLTLFMDHKIDYGFCFGDHILKGEFLKRYKNRIINFHPSLLPHYKGRGAIDRAVQDGVHILGNTAHFLTEEVDGGPVIMQSAIHISLFEQKGTDAVLDLQLTMAGQIFKWLSLNLVSVDEGKVNIKGARYDRSFMVPHL